jgi:Lrp/AsnC family transcriptional regulator, regulator for asnA, asnC and gidA
MKIDENTIAIIKHLRDGRKSFKKIAEDLSLSENTVRTRVNKMQREGILDITGVVDPATIPRLEPVIIGVKLKTTDLINKAEEFSKVRGVVSASVVTGRYDIILVVLFTEEYDLQKFYVEEVSQIEDVQSLETFMIIKSFNLRVPYIH